GSAGSPSLSFVAGRCRSGAGAGDAGRGSGPDRRGGGRAPWLAHLIGAGAGGRLAGVLGYFPEWLVESFRPSACRRAASLGAVGSAVPAHRPVGGGQCTVASWSLVLQR